MKTRQRGELLFRWLLLAKKCSQRLLQKLGHGPTLSQGFLFKLPHYYVADIEGSLHMENHMLRMAICQFQFRAAVQLPEPLSITG